MGKIKICPICGEENPEFSQICGNCSDDLMLVKAIAYDMKSKPGFSLRSMEFELKGLPKLIFNFLITYAIIEAFLGLFIVASGKLIGVVIGLIITIMVLCKGIAVAFGFGHAYLAYKQNQINKENIERIFYEMNKK